MDKPIMMTPIDVWNMFMAICAAIVAVSAAAAVIIKVATRLRAPDKKQNERIAALEEAVERINERLQLGNKRFEADTTRVEQLEAKMNKTNKIIIESLQVIIEHDIDGNNHDSLRNMKHKLDKYLLDKSMGE